MLYGEKKHPVVGEVDVGVGTSVVVGGGDATGGIVATSPDPSFVARTEGVWATEPRPGSGSDKAAPSQATRRILSITRPRSVSRQILRRPAGEIAGDVDFILIFISLQRIVDEMRFSAAQFPLEPRLGSLSPDENEKQSNNQEGEDQADAN
jgi:hypothetical protein